MLRSSQVHTSQQRNSPPVATHYQETLNVALPKTLPLAFWVQKANNPVRHTHCNVTRAAYRPAVRVHRGAGHQGTHPDSSGNPHSRCATLSSGKVQEGKSTPGSPKTLRASILTCCPSQPLTMWGGRHKSPEGHLSSVTLSLVRV